MPPECVYAAWNRIASEKTLRVYPAGRHTVEPWQVEEQLAWLRSRLIGA